MMKMNQFGEIGQMNNQKQYINNQIEQLNNHMGQMMQINQFEQMRHNQWDK